MEVIVHDVSDISVVVSKRNTCFFLPTLEGSLIGKVLVVILRLLIELVQIVKLQKERKLHNHNRMVAPHNAFFLLPL